MLRHQRYGGVDCRFNNNKKGRAVLMSDNVSQNQKGISEIAPALPLPGASCWEVLGLRPGVAAAEIDYAFRKLAKNVHPDAGGRDAAMQALNAAREQALKFATDPLESNKTVLLDALQKAGITVVDVNFDGEGDSGQIEDIQAKADDQKVELPEGQIEIALTSFGQPEVERKTLPIREAIEEIAFALLEDVESGWENDGGAYGEFVFDVAARTITLTFNARFTDISTSQNVF
jgi:hypothetical protein